MPDKACVEFLQWALPQLQLRWPGFRKVRKQVCKRLNRRCQELGLPDLIAYRDYLMAHPAEWSLLESFCRISISRFYRDRAVFDYLAQVVLPNLAQLALSRGETELRFWSVGCASGEEPYTLSLIWRFGLQASFPTLSCCIIATDTSEQILERAQVARYPASSLRELPLDWRTQAFIQQGDEYQLREAYRSGIEFLQQDIRVEQPAGFFHTILCRNLVLTYFEEGLQQQVLAQLIQQLGWGGALVFGRHEQLPGQLVGLQPWFPQLGIYGRKSKLSS
jgi:chemotaxis protein methyltransferase CheR